MFAVASNIKIKLLDSSFKANKGKYFSVQHVIKLQNSKDACSSLAQETMKFMEGTFGKNCSAETSGSQRVFLFRRILWRSLHKHAIVPSMIRSLSLQISLTEV